MYVKKYSCEGSAAVQKDHVESKPLVR